MVAGTDVLRLDRKQGAKFRGNNIGFIFQDFNRLHVFSIGLETILSGEMNSEGKPVFEVRTWEKLSPFYNIARMIDLMTYFITLMLIAVVLISIMNVLIMAVYERVREIGTIAAIETLPGKIVSMFVLEGFTLGVLGAAAGNILGAVIIMILNLSRITFSFGRQTGLDLTVRVDPKAMLIVSLLVILISVIASIQPAIKASRMEPIEALKHV